MRRLFWGLILTITLINAVSANAGSSVGLCITASAQIGRASVTQVAIAGSWASGLSHSQESGSDRVLLFFAHAEHASININLESVSYGGQPMTEIIDELVNVNTRAYVSAYILNEAGIDAATGDTFVPTWNTTPTEITYASVFLSNVNQTTPVGATDSNSTPGGTPNPITTGALSTADGDMVIVSATCGNSGDYTVNNGFTKGIETDAGSSTGAEGYKSATGANETPSVTHTTPNRQVIIGFVVQEFPPFTLTTSSTTGGSVTTPGEGSFEYEEVTDVNIEATSDANYHFVNWTGTAAVAGKVADVNSAGTTVTMDADYTVIANFAIDTRQISGTITCSGVGANNVNMVGLGVATDVNGFYSTAVDLGWSGVVTPYSDYYTFDPNSISYINVTADLTNEDYNSLPADNFNDNRRGAMWQYIEQ